MDLTRWSSAPSTLKIRQRIIESLQQSAGLVGAIFKDDCKIRRPALRICLACFLAPHQNWSMKSLGNRCILAAFPIQRWGQILNHARRRVSLILSVSVVAGAYLFWACDTRAQSDLPAAQEPMLAEPGDWAADFNEAQIACYNGSMNACDSIWKSKRVLFDTFLYQYGRSCGGRVDRRQISRAGLDCTEAFPGYE